jgi:4'-phosphopantetheinyl transferase
MQRRFAGEPVGICLETCRGAIAHALLEYDFVRIFPINPLTLRRFREAWTPSRARDDPTDAGALLRARRGGAGDHGVSHRQLRAAREHRKGIRSRGGVPAHSELRPPRRIQPHGVQPRGRGSPWRQPLNARDHVSSLALPLGELHVWWCESTDVPQSGRSVLTSEERDRCERFRFQEDRRSYLAAHAMVRLLLDRYGCQGSRAPFVVSNEGKPSVTSGPRFSLSHTRGLVACAFAAEMAVGIDVEATGRACRLESLVDRVMSPWEIAALAALQDSERAERLVELWALKEAWAKSLGLGLHADFRTLDTERPPMSLFFSSLESPAGFRLAVAALGAPEAVETRRFAFVGR